MIVGVAAAIPRKYIIDISLWIQVDALNALRVQFGGYLYLLRRYLDP